MTTLDNEYQGEAQPLVEHLRELRHRLMVALGALFVTTLLSIPFAERALVILVSPLKNQPQVLTPTEAIVQYAKVGLIGGLFLAMPVILYQIIAFLTPALTRHEKRMLWFFLPLGTLLFGSGLLFGALIALPVSLRFLQSFGDSFAEIQWTLEAYVDFVTTLLLALGIAFQTPLVIFFLAKLGIVSFPFLVKNTRWAFLIAAILAAVLTPTPDPFTMLIVMLPLFLLYLIGMLLARFA